MQFSSSNPWMRLAALVTVIVVLAVAWYLISPLFFDRQVNEGFPTLAHMPTKTSHAAQTEAAAELASDSAQATAAMQIAMTEVPAELASDSAQATAAMQIAMTEVPAAADNMPDNAGAEMKILLRGDFYDIAHEGMGTATIYELADGSRVLRLENFSVLNGPQLHVYFTSQTTIPAGGFDVLANEVDLGALKGNIGDQNYTLPDGLSLDQVKSVVIWCVPFRVAFNAAPLN